MLDDAMWADTWGSLNNQPGVSYPPCGTSLDSLAYQWPTYRITGPDFNTFLGWQNGKRTQPVTKNLRVSHAFNGVGSTAAWYANDYGPQYLATQPAGSALPPDSLTPAINANEFEFNCKNRAMEWACTSGKTE